MMCEMSSIVEVAANGGELHVRVILYNYGN